MDIRLKDHFDAATLARGRDYARRGLVGSVKALAGGALEARVSNGRGESYKQHIERDGGVVDGNCSCPVGYNCKHVVAALTIWAEERGAQQGKRPVARSGLAEPVQGWFRRIRTANVTPQRPEARPEDCPDTMKARLLYVLVPQNPQVKADNRGRHGDPL